jgi:hypothetical protein
MNQEARRVQGIVRSRTEVEAEGAHERLVADDDGDGGDDGEAQRPHRPQLELLPADAHLRRRPAAQRTNDRGNERAQKITAFRSPRAKSCRQEHLQPKRDRPTLISETASAASAKETSRARPAAPGPVSVQETPAAQKRIWAWGARFWATARQWRGDLGVDRWQWRARPDGLVNQGTGEEGDKE